MHPRYDFLSWFLNALHQRLRARPAKGKPKTSVVEECFQGALRITSRTLPPTEAQLKENIVYDATDPK